MNKTQLDKDFQKIVNDFCERQNMIPEQIGNKAGYFNRAKIHDVFTLGVGTISDKVKNRMVDVMQTIEPEMIVNTVTYVLPTAS